MAVDVGHVQALDSQRRWMRHKRSIERAAAIGSDDGAHDGGVVGLFCQRCGGFSVITLDDVGEILR